MRVGPKKPVEIVDPKFVKNDAGKPRMSLLPPWALESVARVLTFGAEKYRAHNWRLVDERSRYADATLRHVNEYLKGRDIDPDSGLRHLAHAACSVLFLLECEILGLGADDRDPTLSTLHEVDDDE